MRHLSIIILVLAGLAGVRPASAQNLSIDADVLQWDVNNLYDSAANVTTDFTSQFITYGTSKIVWVQKDNYTTEFNIRSVSGDWNDLTSSGSRVYSVKYLDKKGKIRISRNADGLQIRMFFMENTKNTMPYIFQVTAVNKKL